MVMTDIELEIDFSQEGNSGRFCGSGWSGLEPVERWAVGVESRLTIPTPSTPGSYFLVLKFRPLLVPGRIAGQHVDVAVNGAIVGRFYASGTTSRACYLPWQLVEGRQCLEICFRTPDAASPAAFAAGGDDRVLALAFTSLILHRDRFVRGGTRPSGECLTNAQDKHNLVRSRSMHLLAI